jgi:N utilization substance protein A
MPVQTDFMTAVNQIAAERGIDVNEVVSAIADAIKAGFMQNYPEETKKEIEVNVDAEHGKIAVYQQLKVLEEVLDEETEISIDDAAQYKTNPKVGDIIEIDITPEGDFGRVAAQAAKQAILQKIREVEKETQLRGFTDRIGEVEYAVVQRMDGDNVIWEIGKTLAVMPPTERISNEFYKSGNRHKVLIKEIEETARGKRLIVSRAAAEFLQALFELEIPELTSGSIEIKSIAREAGSRSKVAVVSTVEGIDPIGSCVGQKGMRINAIMNELKFGAREEKIDIILWDDNIEQFLANAISPAEVKKVKVTNKKDTTATLTVPDEQLSLAIGKDGQNVRLAAKLTGWKIDIVSDKGKAMSEVLGDKTEIDGLGLSTRVANVLKKAGITTLKELEKYAKDYTKIDGIAKKSAEEIAKKVK